METSFSFTHMFKALKNLPRISLIYTFPSKTTRKIRKRQTRQTFRDNPVYSPFIWNFKYYVPHRSNIFHSRLIFHDISKQFDYNIWTKFVRCWFAIPVRFWVCCCEFGIHHGPPDEVHRIYWRYDIIDLFAQRTTFFGVSVATSFLTTRLFQEQIIQLN